MGKIGIFGGTFDPLHTGHLIVAREVKEILNLDKVLFIPTHISPHKKRINGAPPEIRLEMIKKAIRGIRYFGVDDCEMRRRGISYTVETLVKLKEKYPYDKLYLIAGSDITEDFFYSWKDPERILKLATLCIMNRGNEEKVREHFQNRKHIKYVSVTPIDISSSFIRNRVKKGLPITFYVPSVVERLIYKYGLYI